MIVFLYVCSIIIVLFGISLLIYSFIILKTNHNYPMKKDYLNKFCILIPARDESFVIENLLKSIQNQSIKISSQDVYIIVEDEKDKTVTIADQYGMNIFIRKNLDLKAKGYALDEAIQSILKNKKKYDAYFIFDADNILDPNYLKEMMTSYHQGYDIGISYRNSKNGNQNVVAACSSLTFSMINTIGNSFKKGGNVTISGTGFYIKGTIIEQLNGFPFHTLTEDYEFTLYSILNNLTSTYNKNAIFYDEQPLTLKKSNMQRTRWIRGYIDARRKYVSAIKKSLKDRTFNQGSKISTIIGVWPYIFIMIGVLLFFVTYILSMIITQHFSIFVIIFFFLFVCFVLFIFTFIMLIKEKNMNLNLKMKIKSLFFNPLFLVTYIPCAIKAIVCKNIEWKKIEHTTNQIK